MIISSLIGTIIPMFFHKIKVDPAVASGPLITTVNDLVAVVTYYGPVSYTHLVIIVGGSSARNAAGDVSIPVDATVVGIVDDLEIDRSVL